MNKVWEVLLVLALHKLVESTKVYLQHRSTAYKLTFNNEKFPYAGKLVLQDLAKFCRANETCFDADPRLHAVLEGRREVFLRIVNHLKMTPEELFNLSNRLPVSIQQEKEDD